MPNWVANNVRVSGDQLEIDRFLRHCFRPVSPGDEQPDGIDFCFAAIIPMPPDMNQDWEAFCIAHWRTNREAIETTIVSSSPGFLEFEFLSASDCPTPVFQVLGRLFPDLLFDVAAVDSGAGLAITAMVRGDVSQIETCQDIADTYERIYKEPLKSAAPASRL